MIEKIILDYLLGELSVPVYAEKPNKPPNKYVVIQKIGGGMVNQIKAATISFEAYAGSLYDAAVLNEEVKKALLGSLSLDSISSATLGGESSNLDTMSKSYRYETIFNFYYY